MGKLLGQIFKEDFKSIILWLLLPIASALMFLQLLNIFKDSPFLGIGMTISMTLLTIGPLIALGIAAKNDYERFYGKNAAFYSALPLASSAISGARLVGFILLGILIAIVTFINYIILILVTSNLSIGELLDSIANGIGQIGSNTVLALIITIFTIGLYLVNIIMLANTAGSTKLFGKKSKWAPIIIFLVLFFALGMLSSKIQASALAEYVSSTFNYGPNNLEISAELPSASMAFPIIINIVISAILYGLTYYFHDKKLSVN
jgi:hypothetical protein